MPSPNKFKSVLKGYDYANIGDILSRGGATDPRLFNRMLADQDIQNQMMQRQAMGGLAASGINPLGSQGQLAGAGGSILAALMQGGAATRANTFAQEAALQEQRKREDIINLLFGPKFQRRGLRNQLRIAGMQQPGGGGFDFGGLLNAGANVTNAFRNPVTGAFGF